MARVSEIPLDVLIAEDDEALREMLAYHLHSAGFQVRTACDGPSAIEAARALAPDLVVLDVMLPGCDGVTVCRALRREHDPTPGVLMLTARSSEADMVLALDAGADDYVLKPCRIPVLLARLRALARRLPAAQPPADGIVLGRLRLDPRARRVFVDDREVRLTATELALLRVLARESDRAFTRVELLDRVFGTQHAGYARNVDCHITRLRRKLEEAGLSPPPPATAYGVGYRFHAE